MILSGSSSYYDEYIRKKGTGRTLHDPPSLLTDRGAYVNFLEVQLERVSAACLGVQAYDQRFNDMQQLIVTLEQRCGSTTRLVGLAQQCTEELRTESEKRFNSIAKEIKEEYRNIQVIHQATSTRISAVEQSLVQLGELAQRLDGLEHKVKRQEEVFEDKINECRQENRQLSIALEALTKEQKQDRVELDAVRTSHSKLTLEVSENDRRVYNAIESLEKRCAGSIDRGVDELQRRLHGLTAKVSNDLDAVHKEIASKETDIHASIRRTRETLSKDIDLSRKDLLDSQEKAVVRCGERASEEVRALKLAINAKVAAVESMMEQSEAVCKTVIASVEESEKVQSTRSTAIQQEQTRLRNAIDEYGNRVTEAVDEAAAVNDRVNSLIRTMQHLQAQVEGYAGDPSLLPPEPSQRRLQRNVAQGHQLPRDNRFGAPGAADSLTFDENSPQDDAAYQRRNDANLQGRLARNRPPSPSFDLQSDDLPLRHIPRIVRENLPVYDARHTGPQHPGFEGASIISNNAYRGSELYPERRGRNLMEDPRRTIGRHQGMVNTSPSFEGYQPASSETLDLQDSSPLLRNLRRIDRDAPILNGQHSGPVHPGFGGASMSPEDIYRGPIRSPERGWPQTGRYAESVQSDQAYSLAGSGRRYPGSDDRTFVGDGQQGSQYTQQQRPPFSRPINNNDSLWPPDYGGLQRTGLRDLATSTDTNAAAAAAAPAPPAPAAAAAPAPAPAPTLAPATAAQVTNRTVAVATSTSANSSTSDSSVDSVMHQTEDNTLRQVFGKFLELYREEQGTLKQQLGELIASANNSPERKTKTRGNGVRSFSGAVRGTSTGSTSSSSSSSKSSVASTTSTSSSSRDAFVVGKHPGSSRVRPTDDDLVLQESGDVDADLDISDEDIDTDAVGDGDGDEGSRGQSADSLRTSSTRSRDSRRSGRSSRLDSPTAASAARGRSRSSDQGSDRGSGSVDSSSARLLRKSADFIKEGSSGEPFGRRFDLLPPWQPTKMTQPRQWPATRPEHRLPDRLSERDDSRHEFAAQPAVGEEGRHRSVGSQPWSAVLIYGDIESDRSVGVDDGSSSSSSSISLSDGVPDSQRLHYPTSSHLKGAAVLRR